MSLRWLAALACAAGTAALQLEAATNANATSRQQLFEGADACLDSVLSRGGQLRDAACPVKFYMFDVNDPSVAECYGDYISDKEFQHWVEWSAESHHVGPMFAARYLPKHRCAVQDPEQADLFLVPPFLPQWNKNFDNKDTMCQAKVLKLASKSEAYRKSKKTGHSNFVVLNWWKGREWGTLQTLMFPNATYVGKDCKSYACDDPFVGWPYFDNTPGSFDTDASLTGIQNREKLVVGVWGSRRGGDGQRRPLQAALSSSDDCEFGNPGTLPNHGAGVFDLYRRSKFCLNPRGDSLSRRSLSTCILAGSIPVVLVDGLNLPFEHVLDYSKFAVRFPENTKATTIIESLRAMPADKVEALQRNAVCARRAFLYDARTPKNAVAPGGLLDFLLADIAHVAMRREGWKRPPAPVG